MEGGGISSNKLVSVDNSYYVTHYNDSSSDYKRQCIRLDNGIWISAGQVNWEYYSNNHVLLKTVRHYDQNSLGRYRRIIGIDSNSNIYYTSDDNKLRCITVDSSGNEILVKEEAVDYKAIMYEASQKNYDTFYDYQNNLLFSFCQLAYNTSSNYYIVMIDCNTKKSYRMDTVVGLGHIYYRDGYLYTNYSSAIARFDANPNSSSFGKSVKFTHHGGSGDYDISSNLHWDLQPSLDLDKGFAIDKDLNLYTFYANEIYLKLGMDQSRSTYQYNKVLQYNLCYYYSIKYPSIIRLYKHYLIAANENEFAIIDTTTTQILLKSSFINLQHSLITSIRWDGSNYSPNILSAFYVHKNKIFADGFIEITIND